MTLPLYLVDSTQFTVGADVTLPSDVARHALKSMRLATGDMLQLADGKGTKAQARVIDDMKGVVRVESSDYEQPPALRLGLIQALAKGGRDEQAIETAVEIGVDEIIPWQANRSIVQWKGSKTARGEEKWAHVVHNATEQSRRAYVPCLHPVMSSRQLAAWIARRVGEGDFVVVLHQDATGTWSEMEKHAVALAEEGREAVIWVVVGPEGGISEEEVGAFISAGACVCVIGSTILRASTAGPVALTLLSRAAGRYN